VNLEHVHKIAEAVLYEGYMLYPYRASAVKNQQRWNFGVLCPRICCDAQPVSENWSMQTQCLVLGDASAQFTARIRFLQIVNRSIGKLKNPVREFSEDKAREFEPREFEPVDKFEAAGETYLPWQEAFEREVVPPSAHPLNPSQNRIWPFEFAAQRVYEPITNEDGFIVGVVIREWHSIAGSVELDAEQCAEGIVKMTVRIANLTSPSLSSLNSREQVLPYSFLSVHTILGVECGQFVSLLDPPEPVKALANECANIGTWPVLVGEEGSRDAMLSSPIILYDYPQIAPESPGSLFDGTEIDEILSLRILTMTEEEKREMRQSDQRAREILERTESMPPEQFMKLHGVLRGLRPSNDVTLKEAQ
jgi:hypothetical protein